MPPPVEFSIVIPVYNGGATVDAVVHEVHEVFAGLDFEIVLVNDGSADNSEEVCLALAAQRPDVTSLVQLNRNFGEHNAVLAGLQRSTGRFVGLLDDDGQNPPQELLRLFEHLKSSGVDVVYGRYRSKQHSWFRNLGSWFNDCAACWLLGKPRNLYFSSFKVMARGLVDEVLRYQGPFPYLDGLIFRSTDRISQLDVLHRPRAGGRSGYTFPKLFRLWLNMAFGFSSVPLHALFFLGGLLLLPGCLLLFWWGFRMCYGGVDPPLTSSGAVGCLLLATGVQLMALGIVAEYTGRVLLHQGGMPQYVIRYIKAGVRAHD